MVRILWQGQNLTLWGWIKATRATKKSLPQKRLWQFSFGHIFFIGSHLVEPSKHSKKGRWKNCWWCSGYKIYIVCTKKKLHYYCWADTWWGWVHNLVLIGFFRQTRIQKSLKFGFFQIWAKHFQFFFQYRLHLYYTFIYIWKLEWQGAKRWRYFVQ